MVRYRPLSVTAPRTTDRGQCSNGFSLVELVVSMCIFGIMMALVLLVINAATTTYHSADARIVVQQDIRKALSIMIHELCETNQYLIPSGANASQITFQIPVRPTSGTYAGQMLNNRNKLIYGARTLPTTNPDGTQGYAIRYALVANNDISNTNRLVRRVLDAYPAGNQVGTDMTLANRIRSVTFTRSGKTLSINITGAQHNKFQRTITINENCGITMRN